MPRDIRELRYGGRHAHRCRFQGRRLQPRDVHRTRRVDQAVRGVVVTADDAPLQFLRRAFHPDDWVAVFLKSYESGRVAQRVAPVSVVMSSPCQAWLARENEATVNVYVSVNSIRPRKASRRRTALGAFRPVFREAGHGGRAVLAAIPARRALPPPSYVLHSSPNRVHVLWRVTGFTIERVEALQKQLARELATDSAPPSTLPTIFQPHRR